VRRRIAAAAIATARLALYRVDLQLARMEVSLCEAELKQSMSSWRGWTDPPIRVEA
jgi:hypothetical protein